jgi:HAD superfamily hydrolase (TIGR01509 family)
MFHNMKQKWLLIDFDNCQMETEKFALPSLIKRFNDLYAAQISHELTLEEFKQYFHGLSRETLCERLSNHFKINVDYPTLYQDREWTILQMLQEKGAFMAENLVETLESLERQGYKFAFVSNNPIQRGLAAMRYATNGQGDRLARFFGTAFFEAGDVQKPKPDVYLRAMQQLNTTPEDCVAIEDSTTGVSAAVGAGLTTLGYLAFADDPIAMEAKLKEKGAAVCFNNWKELPSLLIEKAA